MSYTDQFGGTGEAYVKLPVFEAHKKIADGEITPEEADALCVMGMMVCFNTMMDERSPAQKINDYEKYLVMKNGSSKGIEKCDLSILMSLSKEIVAAYQEDKLVEDGELGAFYKEVETYALNMSENADKKERLQEKAKLYRGHAEALVTLKSKFDLLEGEETAERIDAYKTALDLYCQIIFNHCDLIEELSHVLQPTKETSAPQKKEDPNKALLAEKTPEEIQKEVENDTYPPQKRKAFVRCLEEHFIDADVDSYEKLLWLDDTGETAAKLLARMKNFYHKNKSGGWLGTSVKNLGYDLVGAPKIPSRNIFWDILIILASIAVAVLVGFHPAVATFFDSASTAVLAIITIVAFCVGAGFGGLFVGLVVAFVWIVLSFFINKLIPFEKLLQIVAALALLIPGVLAAGDIPSHSKKAVLEAKEKRRRHYEKLLEECEHLKGYIAALTEKLSAVGTEKEGAKTAAKYYDNLKKDIDRTIKSIDGYLNVD